MPCLFVHTNVSVEDVSGFLARVSAETADVLGKPESYAMVKLSDQQPMLFAGSNEPLAFVELKSLWLSTDRTAYLSDRICTLLGRELGVDATRIYIEFAAPERAMFGWSGGTF